MSIIQALSSRSKTFIASKDTSDQRRKGDVFKIKVFILVIKTRLRGNKNNLQLHLINLLKTLQ